MTDGKDEALSSHVTEACNKPQRIDTRWRHGQACFEHPALDDFFGPREGLLPLGVILDPAIGAEVVLILRDQTPFMEGLRQVRPFRLELRTGLGRNEFGPLAFLVFWVPNPADPGVPFAAYDAYINPHSEKMLALWRPLTHQSHWHLFLVGAGNQQREFFEFENTFRLGEALDFFQEACASIPMVDFNRATLKFMQEHTVEELLRLG